MSGLTMLRLLLLMHFVLSAKCHNAPEEDFGALYDVTTSTQTTGTSWRDLQPNITPTVNAEGARELKDLFDNGDRQPDLLTSVLPDGISSSTDYDYASNESVTTDSNDLLTSNESLLTVKWDAADAGGHFTKANLIQNQTEKEQESFFENIQSKNLTNIRVTEILSNEKENHKNKVNFHKSNLINDTEITNIDSVESIFEDLIENVTNLSSEEVSEIVDVDRIFSGDDQFSTVAFPNFSTVDAMNFHNLFASERSDNYTSEITDETTVEESSGDEPLTLVTIKYYFPGAPSLFDASNSTNHLQFENLQESSGDEPSETESNTFSNNDSYSHERLSIITSESPAIFSRVVDFINTEKTVEDIGKDENILLSQYGYENWENSNGFEDEVKSTNTISSQNILTYELGKLSNENKTRVGNTGENHEATTLLNQLGHEDFKGENEDVSVSLNIETTSNINADSETSTINYFMRTQNIEVLDGYKSASESGTESFGLKNTSEELQVGQFNESNFVTEQLIHNSTSNTNVDFGTSTISYFMRTRNIEVLDGQSGTETFGWENVSQISSEDLQVKQFNESNFFTEQSIHNSGNHTNVLDLGNSKAEHLTDIPSFTEQSNIQKEDTETTPIQNFGTDANVPELDGSEEGPYSATQTIAFDLDIPTTLRNDVQNINTESLKLTIEPKTTNKSFWENLKNNIEDEISNLTFTTKEEIGTTSIHNIDLFSESTQTNEPSSDVSTTPKNEARSKNLEVTTEMSFDNKSDEILQEDAKNNNGSSGDGPFPFIKFDEEKFTEAITVTDSNLSTTTEASSENIDALEMSTKAGLEDKSHRMAKKLNRLVQDSKDNNEIFLNADGTREYHFWTTQKIVVPESELHGEYVYTDVETSKSFDGVVDQNFIEYGEDVDDTKTHVENSLVTEQNQIEQAFTLPNSGKTEEENKLPRNSFQDGTTAVFHFDFDVFPSTTEGYLKSTQDNEKPTAVTETPVNVEENKTARRKLEDDFDESIKSTRSDGFDFFNFVTDNAFPSTTSEEHLQSTQENEITSISEVEGETKQSLPINSETDVYSKENERVRSKFEDDSYMKNTFQDFKENLNLLEQNDSSTTGSIKKEKILDQVLDLWKIPNSNEIQTIVNVQTITPREIKNDQEFTTQNVVALTSLTVNQDFVSHKKEIDDKERDGRRLMESTTAGSKSLNVHVMEEGVNFDRHTDITEKNTMFTVPYEREKQSRNTEFKSDEEFSEPTSENGLIILKVDEDFMSYKEGIEVSTANEDIARNESIESTTARETSTSLEKLNTVVLQEDLRFNGNEDYTFEYIVEKNVPFSFNYENKDSIFEDVSTTRREYLQTQINKAENETYATEKVTVTLNVDQENEIEDESKFSTTEATTSYHIRDFVQKELATHVLGEDFTERAIRILKESEVEEVTVIPTVNVKVTNFRGDFEENFTFKLVNDSENEEDINIKTGTTKLDVASNIDLTISPLNNKNETPVTEEIFIVETHTEPLVSDLQTWKGAKEEENIAKKILTFEDSSLTTTLAPVTLLEEINKTYFTEESFSVTDENDTELHLQQNAEVTEEIEATEGINMQVFTVKTVSNLNSNFDDLKEEIENRDNLTMNPSKDETDADHINTMMTDLIQESETTSAIVPGNQELDLKNVGSLEKENITLNLLVSKSEIDLKTTAATDIMRKENLSEEDYADSIEVKSEEDCGDSIEVKRDGSVTKNASQIEDQEDEKKLENQITAEMTTTVASDMLYEKIDEGSMTSSTEADFTYKNQVNSRKGKQKTLTTQVETEANKQKEKNLKTGPNTLDLELKNSDSIENEKEDKSISMRVKVGIEWTTEIVNIIQEEVSEENSTSTKTELDIKNLENTTQQTERRNTQEQELEITEEITTSNFKLFNKVETNGRFLNPQLHLDEVSSNEDEDNFMNEDRSNQRDRKRNENVQLDSPVVEITTVPENTTPSSNHHQMHSNLNKSGKIFGEISKRIFQKYIDIATTVENVVYKEEHATERNYIATKESEEDDDEWIQTNGFINKINFHRDLQNVNKSGVNKIEWEIIFDSRHRTNVDSNDVIITQKRDVIVRESIEGSQMKAEENLINLNLCSSWIEQKNRNCLTSGGLGISFLFGNFTTRIPVTAKVSDFCNDKNHIIDVTWVVNRTASGVLSLQLHIGEVDYWIDSVSFQLELSDKRHTEISVSDLVILKTQIGDHMQGIINITSTSDLQLLIHVIDVTSMIVDDCTTKEAKVFLEHELVLIIGAATLTTIIVLLVAVLLLYKKFRTTASAYKMAIE